MMKTAMSILSLLLFALVSQVSPTGYTEKMFQTAIDNDSTSPNYVLITMVDGNTKKSRQICVTANLFRGAIEKEYGLSTSDADLAKENKIILSHPDRIFVFFKQKALENIRTYYTEEQLNEVRARLEPLTLQQLKYGFNFQQLCRELAEGKPSDAYSAHAYNDAIAHVLLEKGILCGQGDMTGSVYINEP